MSNLHLDKFAGTCILEAMRWHTVPFLFVGMVALVYGAIPQGAQPKPPVGPDPRPILQAKCAGCHHGATAAAGIDLSGDLASVALTKAVVRGRPHDSALFKTVDNGSMPRGGTKLSDADRNTIRDWVFSLRPDPRPLFQAKCVGCHGANGPAAGLSLTGSLEDLAKLRQIPAAGQAATDSSIYKRIADGSMPKGGAKLSDAEMTLVKDWLSSVHPDPHAIFQAQCVNCHGAKSPAAALDLTKASADLKDAPQVIKGEPWKSAIYQRLADGSMPQGGKRLSDSDVGLVWDWVLSLQPPKKADGS